MWGSLKDYFDGWEWSLAEKLVENYAGCMLDSSAN
jgi:hypothetical protein